MLDLLTATRVCVHLAAQRIATHHHVADSFLFTPMLPIATGCALAKGLADLVSLSTKACMQGANPAGSAVSARLCYFAS